MHEADNVVAEIRAEIASLQLPAKITAASCSKVFWGKPFNAATYTTNED